VHDLHGSARTIDEVVGGAIPGQFIPAVEKGVREALQMGVVAGYPLVDVQVAVYEGKYHSVDSKEIAFSTAGRKAFVDAALKAFGATSKGVQTIAVEATDYAKKSFEAGTATLETALLGTPFFLLYKASASTFFLGRRLVKIPYIGLVNVLAGRHVVPEFIQCRFTAAALSAEAEKILTDPARRDRACADLRRVSALLGPPGAAGRIADSAAREFAA
jgi:hypothetical protein